MNISIHSLESLVIVNTNISTIDICDSQGWLLVYGILVYLNIFNDFLMTAWQLPDNVLATALGLADDWLKNGWWLHDDCLMTDWWKSVD